MAAPLHLDLNSNPVQLAQPTDLFQYRFAGACYQMSRQHNASRTCVDLPLDPVDQFSVRVKGHPSHRTSFVSEENEVYKPCFPRSACFALGHDMGFGCGKDGSVSWALDNWGPANKAVCFRRFAQDLKEKSKSVFLRAGEDVALGEIIAFPASTGGRFAGLFEGN
jgi:hypothetical protein